MREVAPTRSAAIALAEERKLMRQGYDFLDEKRTLLATEILRQLKVYQQQTEALAAATQSAAGALAAALERHGLDQLQAYPAPATPDIAAPQRSLFLGLAMLTAAEAAVTGTDHPPATDASPEAKACRAAFEKLLALSADTAVRAGNLNRLAREYRRTERRAQALEKVLLLEVAEAIKQVNEQLDTMEREETIRTRWSSHSQNQ
jgi:V/A-type H+-transporting ATPase subunit D